MGKKGEIQILLCLPKKRDTFMWEGLSFSLLKGEQTYYIMLNHLLKGYF